MYRCFHVPWHHRSMSYLSLNNPFSYQLANPSLIFQLYRSWIFNHVINNKRVSIWTIDKRIRTVAKYFGEQQRAVLDRYAGFGSLFIQFSNFYIESYNIACWCGLHDLYSSPPCDISLFYYFLLWNSKCARRWFWDEAYWQGGIFNLQCRHYPIFPFHHWRWPTLLALSGKMKAINNCFTVQTRFLPHGFYYMVVWVIAQRSSRHSVYAVKRKTF